MAVVLGRFRYCKPIIRLPEVNKQSRIEVLRCSTKLNESSEGEETTIEDPSVIDGFEVFRIYPKEVVGKKSKAKLKPENPPRTTRMTPDQDWPSVWPGPRTFHPASVPLPIRQGCNKYGAPPDKYANTELMKIPNFLHLTPPAIERHCNAIKKYCTQWPEELKDDETIEKHFPVEVISSDYCHASSSIRDPNARIISLRIKLKNLELDEHSRDKFLRLVGPRYDPKSDYVTITTDSCPLKKQNYEYAHYLMTAAYFESWKHEEWENMKGDDDMEIYNFPNRQCFRNIKTLFQYNNREIPDLEEHKKGVESWLNEGDSKENIKQYKQSVLKLMGFSPLEAEC